MQKSWLLCALLGTLAWGQAAPTAAPTPAAPTQARPAGTTAQSPADTSASVPDSAAVITVNGVCSPEPRTTAAKGTTTKPSLTERPSGASAADCKTVVTKAEFERLVKGAMPAANVNPQTKKQLANLLPRLMALSNDAKKKGLDKTPQFEEMMKVVRMQMLARELDRSVQEEAAKVPDQDIEMYYQKNSPEFEQFSLERLFVPRTKVDNEPKESEADKLSEEQEKAKQAAEKAKQEEEQQAMSKLADDLRARAAAGEDFETLQKEAFTAAGMKIESPTVKLPGIRRNGLPTAHAAVFDLKPGDVSQVLSDNGGHYIYKMESKTELPLEQVKNEIHSKLQSQRYRETMDKLNASYHAEMNEAYFGPGGATAPPPQRIPMHRPPGSMAPPAQTPPSSQAPAPPQAAQPN
jgi:PPIC-type PPIASE domain